MRNVLWLLLVALLVSTNVHAQTPDIIFFDGFESSDTCFWNPGGCLLAEGVVGPMGGTIAVEDPAHPLYGLELEFPLGSLISEETIEVYWAPGGQDLERLVLQLEPSGLELNDAALLKIPMPDQDTGSPFAFMLSDLNELEDLGSETSRFIPLDLIAIDNDSFEVGVPHFSTIHAGLQDSLYIAMHIPGKYLKKGDLIYALTMRADYKNYWIPGHAALYLGADSAESMGNDGETIIEASPDVVRLTMLSDFKSEYGHLYMGARRHRGNTSDEERVEIASFALDQEGEPYNYIGQKANKKSIGADLLGWTCVELTEEAYEAADKNILSVGEEAPLNFPVKQFNATDPVDQIQTAEGSPIEAFEVYGVERGEKYSYREISASAYGLVGDMEFQNNQFSWPNPSEGTHQVRFSASTLVDGSWVTIQQPLTIKVWPSEVLYDVDFGTPPHTVGYPPVTGAGPVPRDVVSEINFGSPIVKQAVADLTDQPLEFYQPGSTYRQIEFHLDDLPAKDSYSLECDVTVVEISDSSSDFYAFTILFDTPTVRNIHFTKSGVISVWSPYGNCTWNNGRPEYTFGESVHLKVFLDLTTDSWDLYVNGEHACFCTLGSISQLRAIRFSTDTQGERTAIDNVVIAGASISQ